MSVYPGGDAMRLLRAINMDQAHGRVGSIVLASDAARSVGLEPGSERYEEAVWRLLVEGALRGSSLPPWPGGGAHAGRGIGAPFTGVRGREVLGTSP